MTINVPIVVPVSLLLLLSLAGVCWLVWWTTRRHGNGRRCQYEGLYCYYCHWPVGRSVWFEALHWSGHTYCSLVCLRRDEMLVERERCA
mgnify:CR=1 FL=1